MHTSSDYDLSAVKIGEHIKSGVFCLIRKDVAKTRKGDEYLNVELVNARRQRISGKVWQNKMEAWKNIELGNPVEIEGMIEDGYPSGQGLPPSLKIDEVKALPTPHPVQGVMNPIYDGDVDDLKKDFWGLVGRIQHPGIRRFVEVFFGEKGICFEDFSAAPAANQNHHAYLHGLLEHTVEVCWAAIDIAKLPRVKPYVNIDLVIAGSLIHDAGKVHEYVWKGCPIAWSPVAGLTNHIATGVQMTARVHGAHAEELAGLGFSDDHRIHLEHIILSHHGRKEWGALVVPKTPAAFVVHQADMTSAHIRQTLEVVKGSVPDQFGRINGGRTFVQGLVVDLPNFDGNFDGNIDGNARENQVLYGPAVAGILPGSIGCIEGRARIVANPMREVSEETSDMIIVRPHMVDEAANVEKGIYTGDLGQLLREAGNGRKKKAAARKAPVSQS